MVGKLKGLTKVKDCLNYMTNIDTVLIEKMLQFKRPAAQFVRIPAGAGQGFTPLCHLWA